MKVQRHLTCATCGAIEPEGSARTIPTWKDDRYTDVTYCAVHAAVEHAALDRQIAAIDLEADDFDAQIPLIDLVAYLSARDRHMTSVPVTGEGMEAIRNGVLELLRLAAEGEPLPAIEPTALCSACVRGFPASQVRVLPHWNETAGAYVTTFRCAACWPDAIAATRDRLAGGDDAELDRLAAFFAHYAIFVHEHRRGDGPAVTRPLFLQLLDRVDDGSIVLPVQHPRTH